jgi:hypothetical protein
LSRRENESLFIIMAQRDKFALDVPGAAASGHASNIAESAMKAHVSKLPLVLTTLCTSWLQHGWGSCLSLNVYNPGKKLAFKASSSAPLPPPADRML